MPADQIQRSEEHTSELQSPCNLVCRLLLEKKKKNTTTARLSDFFRLFHYFRTRRAAPRYSPSRCRLHAIFCRSALFSLVVFFFFFNDTATTEIYTLSLHDALPISDRVPNRAPKDSARPTGWCT